MGGGKPQEEARAGRPLPRGPHRLAREVILASQRGRMLEAMAEAVSGKGYGATTVADVVGRAGVSRKTFYEHFANKEECFLAAYDVGVDALLHALLESVRDLDPRDPLPALDTAVRCYLDTLAANPTFARTFLVEVLAAGPRALDRRAAVHERFAELLVRVHGASGEPRPRDLYRACVGAVHELVRGHLLADGPASLPELHEPVSDVIVALLIGRQPAPGA